MAKRLSYYAEAYGLLPNTQFGGRPGRNPEQALLVLRNAIDRAWLASKVITLVAFDLKGAFNGVSSNILDLQLKAKGIPTKLRTWVASFTEGRSASISFDDFESTRSLLAKTALASVGKISLSNYCDIEYFLWSVSNIQSEMQHLPPGGVWRETYRTNPNGGGVSVKLSKVQAPIDISQIEYIVDTVNAKIWYDLSNINAVQQIPVTDGIRIAPQYSDVA
jgi:hypothetical protein